MKADNNKKKTHHESLQKWVIYSSLPIEIKFSQIGPPPL